MRNLIVFLVLIIWAGGFAYALFNHKDITESQSYSLSKLDTLITLIIGYYLKQNIKTNETD
jgi:glucose uptake protein GlcU